MSDLRAAQQDLFRAGMLSLVVNIVLMLTKISVGFWGNSYALVADGIESAGDILASLITWAGVQLSLRPADSNHPFGHGRLEAVAGMFSGFALLAAAAFITWSAIREIQTPHHAPEWFTLPVLLGVVAVKYLVARQMLGVAESHGSTAARGDAWHHISDAMTSAAAAVGISIALIGGEGYESADDWAALVACGFIAVNGFGIMRSAFNDVMDAKVGDSIFEGVQRTAQAVPGVVNTEKCRIRKSGLDLFVELHVRVRPDLTVTEGHRIGHDVKTALMGTHTAIQDVLIHIEPAENAK